MEKEISALVPEHLCRFLQTGGEGEILLVTSAGIYLRIGERILLLCDAFWGTLPIGIGIRNFDGAVSGLHLQQGQQVRVTEDRLHFPSGGIRLIPRRGENTETGNSIPQISRIRQAAEELSVLGKERGISMLVQPLILGQALTETQKANPYGMHACLRFAKLIAAFEENDDFETGNCIKKLLGLGPGLTPSADDCLLGMLYVFGKLPLQAPSGAEYFRTCIARNCSRGTNQISAAYLKAVIEGAPFERMECIFRGLCGDAPLEIQKLTQIGSSSGSEMLLGMLLALRLCGYDVRQKEELQ